MHKKLVIAVLALTMLLSFSACNAKTSSIIETQQSEPVNSEQPTQKDEPSPAGITSGETSGIIQTHQSEPVNSEQPTPKEEPSPAGTSPEETVSQKNAVRTAMNYLDFTAFSRQGLIKQLEYEGFSNADAIYGADHSDADWMEQAVKCAENYLEYTAFSAQGLIEQLEYEGFTHEQAVYGVDASGLGDNASSGNSEPSSGSISSGETVSQQNAVRAAKDYIEYTAFSRQGLIEQLEYEGFSNADAIYGADRSGADWMEQAVKCAEEYLEYSAFSRQGLIEQLEYEGFTHEQAVHGVDATGL
jgi:SOS response regulatory protein OraA/RecX